MKPQKHSVKARNTTKVVAASGRLRNDHFLLTADHLLLEVDHANFELVSAMAEGGIQMHMLTRETDEEYIIYAQSAVYHPEQQRVVISGWQGTRENGIDYPPAQSGREVYLPTDGTFYFPTMSEQAEKRLPVHFAMKAAA
jgi:hypothetical protein